MPFAQMCGTLPGNEGRVAAGQPPLLQVQLGPADSSPFEVEIYVDMVADLDEQDALVHPVVLAVEGHFPFNLA